MRERCHRCREFKKRCRRCVDVVGKITALESLNSDYLNIQGVLTVDHSTARVGTGSKKGCRVRAVHKYSGGQEQWSNKGARSGQKRVVSGWGGSEILCCTGTMVCQSDDVRLENSASRVGLDKVRGGDESGRTRKVNPAGQVGLA